jgi:hypothetical protein
VKGLFCEVPFDGICHFLCRFIVIHISPTKSGELTSHHPCRWKAYGAARCPEGIVCNTDVTTSESCSPWHDTLPSVDMSPIHYPGMLFRSMPRMLRVGFWRV